MKKFLLSIFAVLFAFAGVQAQETATLSFASTAQRTLFSTTQQVWEQNGITFTNNKASSTTNVANYSNPVRLYANSEVIVEHANTMTKIVFVCSGSSYATALKNSIGNAATASGSNVTVEPNSTSFTIAKLTAQVRVKSITVTYTAGGGEDTKTVSPPTFDPADGAIFTGATLPVTISTVTEGAIIHYKINDDAEQTGASPVSVNITETTKIVAYATLDGYENSANSTATYTKVTPISIAEARAACTTNGVAVVMDLSGAQVIGVGGNYMFVQKEGVGICLYQSSPKYKLGDVFAEGSYVAGSAKNYGGLHELADYTITTSGVTNSELEKNVVSFSDVTVENSCTYITLENVIVDGSNLVSGENSLAYYDTFNYINGSTLPTTSCTVTGVLSVYSDNLQILPLEIVSGPAQLPILSVEGGGTEGETVEVYLNSVLTITPAEGSSVTYTMGANSATVTEETEILFDSEGAVALTIAVEQKFYTPIEKTYFYNVVEANVPCTVSFSANGVIVGTETVNLGGFLATAPEVSAPEDLEFIGWAEDKTTMELVEFPYLVNSDITLYAVYSVTSEGGTSWNLVEDVNDINAGDEIVIVGVSNTKNQALGAMSNTSTKYHTVVNVELTADKKVLTNIGDAKVLTVGKSNEYYTFSYGVNYLYWSSGNSLATSTTISDNTSWAIAIEKGVATITNKEDATRMLQYNATNTRFACYLASSNQQNLRIYKKTAVVVTTIKYHTLSVSAAGWATLYLDFAAAIPAEVEAYTVTEVNNGYVTLTQVTGVLPANTGVIVKADEADYNFFASTETPATVTGNLLQGTVAATEINVEAYVLGNVDGVGLYKAKMTDGKWLNNAYKAYLPASALTPAQLTAAFYGFDWNGTTGIEKVEIRNEKSEIYDLTGRRIDAITAPGIYVVNGKKILVK